MMNRFARMAVSALVLGAMMLSPDTLIEARADGLILQLPKDGTFAEYDLKIGIGKDRNATGTLKIASVGSEVVKKEKCRWVEMTLTLKLGGDSLSQVFKMLIPEKQLKRGGNPLQDVVRAWQKQGDGKPTSLNDPASVDRPLSGMLAGPLEKSKKLPPTETASSLGKLKCPGFSGSITVAEPDKKRSVAIDVTTRTHAKSPFGVVTSKMAYAITRDGNQSEQGTIEFKLTKVGNKAVSALPDKK